MLEDVKRANAAVKAAEDKLLEMGVTLEEEERQLEVRHLLENSLKRIREQVF